jgi:TctA family transporter
MIQRIQTVYLLLSAILSIVTLFIPVYGDVTGLDALMVTIPAIGNAVLAIVVISQFKDRIRQLGIGKILIFMSAFFVGIVAFQAFSTEEGSLTFGTFIPLIVNMFNLLALRGIRSDERLVRESDRLR